MNTPLVPADVFGEGKNNEKGEVITSRKGIANVIGEFCRKMYDDDQCDETELETAQSETENDKGDQSAGVEETKEIPEFTTEELQAAQGQTQKKEKQETATESEPKTSKHVTKRQKK